LMWYGISAVWLAEGYHVRSLDASFAQVQKIQPELLGEKLVFVENHESGPSSF